MIVNLDKDWFIDADGQSCVLTERRVIQAREEGEGKGKAPKPENVGKIREVQHGFYGRIDQAATAYLSKSVASMDGMFSATQIVAAWADKVACVEAACRGIPRKGEVIPSLPQA